MSFFTNASAIIFKKRFTQQIGKLEIDIVSSRNITEKVALTSNPIEGGFNTDHARDEPTQIIITGVISTFSLNNSKITQLTTLGTGEIPNRLKEAHDELRNIKDAKEPINLIMKYRTYSSMVMIGLDMPNDATDGESFRFTATFQEARIVTSLLMSTDNSKISLDSAKKKSSYGRQPTEKREFKMLSLTELWKRKFN